MMQVPFGGLGPKGEPRQVCLAVEALVLIFVTFLWIFLRLLASVYVL